MLRTHMDRLRPTATRRKAGRGGNPRFQRGARERRSEGVDGAPDDAAGEAEERAGRPDSAWADDLLSGTRPFGGEMASASGRVASQRVHERGDAQHSGRRTRAVGDGGRTTAARSVAAALRQIGVEQAFFLEVVRGMNHGW